MPESSAIVSVIVPVYNGERFLADCLRNIEAQNYRPLEIVVVNDGSEDATDRLARNLGSRIRYVTQPNSGPAAARNSGVAASSGEFLTFQDVDDSCPPHKVSRLASLLLGDPGVDVARGLTRPVMAPGSLPASASELRPRFGMNLGNALFRRAVFARVGPFDPAIRIAEDLEWFARAKRAGIRFAHLNEVTLFYQRHGAGLTADQNRTTAGIVQVVRGLRSGTAADNVNAERGRP